MKDTHTETDIVTQLASYAANVLNLSDAEALRYAKLYVQSNQHRFENEDILPSNLIQDVLKMAKTYALSSDKQLSQIESLFKNQ